MSGYLSSLKIQYKHKSEPRETNRSNTEAHDLSKNSEQIISCRNDNLNSLRDIALNLRLGGALGGAFRLRDRNGVLF
ncbi:unnamed protein product [Rotaria sp. Silwood2]|nr:unnamed protein product [Rotaria sp. Silwood2]CAF4281798.1 unnamed protein product [Rotaria sp. Silwood2]